MRENICTIPINEIFESKKGCPICRINSIVEKQYVDFIVGDAMMEPSVRVAVNAEGFCRRHFEQMLEHGSRLPVALMLETHLEYIENTAFGDGNVKKQWEKLMEIDRTCYVCERIRTNFDRMLESLIEHWNTDIEFRELYKAQEYICSKHCALLLEKGSKCRKMRSSDRNTFCSDTIELSKSRISLLRKDISHFCKMYDYRNRGADWGDSKDAIERSIAFLTAENKK